MNNNASCSYFIDNIMNSVSVGNLKPKKLSSDYSKQSYTSNKIL